MSFAPPKTKRKNSDSPGRSQDKRNALLESVTNLPTRIKGNLEPELFTRLEVIEANLSRISQQQDALLPLMNMIDLTSNVTKNEGMMKSLHKKCAETDEKLARLEQGLKAFQGNIENSISKISVQKQPQVDLSLFEKNFKNIINQINDQGGALRDLETNVVDFQKAIDSQLKEESKTTQRLIENSLEKHKQDINIALNEFRANNQNSFKRYEEVLKDLHLKVIYFQF